MEQVYVCCAQRRDRPIVSAALSTLLEAVVLRVVGASLAVDFFRREWLVLRMRSRLYLALQRKKTTCLAIHIGYSIVGAHAHRLARTPVSNIQTSSVLGTPSTSFGCFVIISVTVLVHTCNIMVLAGSDHIVCGVHLAVGAAIMT